MRRSGQRGRSLGQRAGPRAARLRLAALAVELAAIRLAELVEPLLGARLPFGFVAMLGMIALMGIIMRNTIILIDQIKHFFAHYKDLEPGKWAKIEHVGHVDEAKKLIREAIARGKKPGA